MEIVVGAKRGNPIILHFMNSLPFKLSLLHPVCNSAVKLGQCSALETGVIGNCSFYKLAVMFNDVRILTSLQKKAYIHKDMLVVICKRIWKQFMCYRNIYCRM